MKHTLTTCIISLFFTGTAIAGTLSPMEVQLKNAVISQQFAQRQLLEKCVNIQSGTNNVKGIYQVGAVINQAFKDLGFKTKWVYSPAYMHKAGTFIAEHPGTSGKRILLIGHLDTVFFQDKVSHPFTIKNNIATGSGTTDDKGGVMVLLYALKAMQTAHVLNNANITVVLTGDEEDSGKPTTISRKPLIDVAKHSDVALDFEPAVSFDTATIARRGISNWTITTHGKAAHSAAIFDENVGDGAIYELARILTAIREQYANSNHITVNPGLMMGGTKDQYDNVNKSGSVSGKQNVVAQTAMATGDFRFFNPEQKTEIEKTLSNIVKKHLPGTTAEITFESAIPAMAATKGNHALLQQYSQVSEDLGQGKVSAVKPEVRGAGDISHVASIVPANLSGLGAIGSGVHTIDEEVELSSLPIQTQRVAILIYRLTR